jgi:Uma2 family endonuclease
MTTVAPAQPRRREIAVVPETITLENVSWELYEMLVRERDESGQHLKITYDRGTLIIMSPLPIHERVKKFLARLVETASMDRDFTIASYGSTTWKRKDVRAGTEPDECYYVGHEPDFDPHKYVNLRKYPAPDLAIEVDITSPSDRRLRVYAALKVKEVWVYDGDEVSIQKLKRGGRYEQIRVSRLLPFITAGDINRFVGIFITSGEMAAIRAVREWLKSG